MRATLLLRDPDPHRVAVGEAASWRVPSSTYPGLDYRVTLYGDGSWGCTCPGFRHGRRADGLCKNIDWAREQLLRGRDIDAVLAGP